MEAGVKVIGMGRVPVTPSQLQAQLRVQCFGADVAAAVSDLTSLTNALLSVTRERGVPPEDVLTAGLRVEPHWSGQGERHRDGFAATHQLTVSLTDSSAFGELLSALVEVAGNDLGIDSVRPIVADLPQQRNQARRAAFLDARDRAEQLAELAGRRLGEVAWVNEQYAGSADDRHHRFQEAALDRGVDVQPGSTTITAAITICWHWE